MLAAKIRFSVETAHVLAGLDRSLPVDSRALEALEKHKVVVPVTHRPGLFRRLRGVGFEEEHLRDVYLIPMRKPSEVKEDLHRRSLHTIEEIDGRKFVFKGSGLAGHSIIASRESLSDS